MKNSPSKTETKVKQLFKGLFSYSCELERVYAYAYSKKAARVIMCTRLAKKHDVHPSVVMGLFPAGGENYSIEIEMEIKEAI